MIIVRVPFRVSFFGGGTDISDWFRRHGGAVLSTTVDKYCYVTVRHLPPYFDHSIRVAYSKVETVRRIEDIEHPLVRAALSRFKRTNVEIHYDADVPARSGLGTSSSFAVGLVDSLARLEGKEPSVRTLASEAIRLERHVLREKGGYQDQIAAAYGGLNVISFDKSGHFEVEPLVLPLQRAEEFQRDLMLCHIPTSRISAHVSPANDYDPASYDHLLEFIHGSVEQAKGILLRGHLPDIGELLHETWVRKRQFKGASNGEINEAYDAAREAGAVGGKILGAGGGGFMLLVCPPEKQERVKKRLSRLLFVPFSFETSGAKVMYYQPDAG